MKKTLPKILILLLLPTLIWSQADSIVLVSDQLKTQNLVFYKTPIDQQQVIAASRSLKNVKDLPFTIHVVSKEEIQNNGYMTLADVLKMVPGIRVSQPGSGLEGETFLMRGLQGNAYAKIMINGFPIKPSIVSGLPIAAQIPIRQAQRIEILYGPGAALYGADASAGIINIVLEKTDRPINALVDLSIGNLGSTNIDATFGGKMGRGKNVLRFLLYGSSTFRTDQNFIHKNQDLFDPEKYSQGNPLYTLNPNYQGEENNPIINAIPHQSSMIGVNLDYRKITLSAQVMARRDHSAIGLNPYAVSYANPINFISDRIINMDFSIRNSYRKFGFDTKFSYLQYLMDNQSSYTYVNNSLFDSASRIIRDIARDSTGMVDRLLADSLSNDVYEEYFSGNRYSFAESHDFQWDQSFNFYLKKNFEVTTGFVTRLMGATPINNYSPVPQESFFAINSTGANTIFLEQLTPFNLEINWSADISAFIQAYYVLQNFSFLGGYQFYSHSTYGRSFNPRLAILYKANDKWSIRGFYGRAFRAPSLFFKANSFVISGQDSEIIRQIVPNLKPEITESIEIGTRWHPNKNLNLDFVVFINENRNIISYNYTSIAPNILNKQILLGYFNQLNLRTSVFGIQSRLVWKDFMPRLRLSQLELNLNIAEGFEITEIENDHTQGVAEQPLITAQARIKIQPAEWWTFTLDHVFLTKSLNKVRSPSHPEFVDGYYTLDILGRYQFHRNFQFYIKVKNVFNSEYGGLAASSTIDDLIFNPQSKRTFQLGVSYGIR